MIAPAGNGTVPLVQSFELVGGKHTIAGIWYDRNRNESTVAPAHGASGASDRSRRSNFRWRLFAPFYGKDAKMRIAITHATGTPNPAVANRLAQAGHHVRCLLDPNVAWDESEHWDRTIEWLLGSVYDPASIACLVHDADAVFHVASPIDQDDLEAGVIVPMRVLLAAYEAGVPHFVFVSPGSTFEVVLHAHGVKGIRRVPAQA
jgi:hypothetical protein